MWVVKGMNSKHEVYYTGKVGKDWLVEGIENAFQYEFEQEAVRVSELFTNRVVLHGYYFNAVEYAPRVKD